jgi:thioredoxin
MPSSCSKKSATQVHSESSSQTPENTDFSAFISSPGTINIVDFTATWCGPCQQLKPVLDSIAKEHSGTVQLRAIDIDKEKSLAAQKGVGGIPDVRFYINGKEVDKFMGAYPKEHIDGIIAKLVKNHAEELKQNTNTTATPAAPIQPISAPAAPAAPTSPVAPNSPTAPAAPAQPTIQPSKGNSLPPGMSKG